MEDKPKDKSAVVLSILKGKEDFDRAAESIKNSYKIEEKTLKEWEYFFRISIPEDPFPAECRQILVNIGNKYEEATRLAREYQTKKQLVESIYEAQYNSAFVCEYNNALEYNKEDKKRMPSKEVLERKARANTSDFEDMAVHADIISQFFKQICDKLSNQRKIIENISITHGIEAKLAPTNGDHY